MAWLLDFRLGHPVPHFKCLREKSVTPHTLKQRHFTKHVKKLQLKKKEHSSPLCWVLSAHVANINWWRGQSSELVVSSGRKNTCPQRCPTRCRQVRAARVSSDSWGEPSQAQEISIDSGLTAPENQTLDPLRTWRRIWNAGRTCPLWSPQVF